MTKDSHITERARLQIWKQVFKGNQESPDIGLFCFFLAKSRADCWSYFLLHMGQTGSNIGFEASSNIFSPIEDISRRRQRRHRDKEGQHMCFYGVLPWGTEPVTSESASFRAEPLRNEWVLHTSVHSSVKLLLLFSSHSSSHYSLLQLRNQISGKTLIDFNLVVLLLFW